MDPISLFASQIIPVIVAFIRQLDPQCWDHLKAHQHKIICFNIDHFFSLYFQIQEHGLKSIPNIDHKPDVSFQGPLNAFIAMIFAKNRVQQHGLHIKGDLECAKALYDMWHHLDADWEGYFSRFVGPTIAHQVNLGMTQGREWIREIWQARQEDLAAYLQDEIRILPTKREVDDLISAIDSLRHDVDRFESKFILLQKRFTQT